MSSEKVEVVRRILAAFNAGDADAMRTLWTADGEWRPAFTGGGLVEDAVYRGHEALSDYVAIQGEAWERVVADPVTLRELGDRVLVRVDLDAIGRASGIPLHQVTWAVFEMRGGRAAVGRVYTTEQEALEAVGLTEP